MAPVAEALKQRSRALADLVMETPKDCMSDGKHGNVGFWQTGRERNGRVGWSAADQEIPISGISKTDLAEYRRRFRMMNIHIGFWEGDHI